VQVFPTIANVPVTDPGLALGTAVIRASDIPSLFGEPPQPAFFTASGFSVNVDSGDVLAIVLSTSDRFGYFWSGGGAAYEAGEMFQRGANLAVQPWLFRSEWDLAFREYVAASEVTAVPEPKSLELLVCGLALIGARIRVVNPRPPSTRGSLAIDSP